MPLKDFNSGRLLSLLKNGDVQIYDRIGVLADKKNVSMSSLVVEAVLKYLMEDRDSEHEFLVDIEKRIKNAKSARLDEMVDIMRRSGQELTNESRAEFEKSIEETGTWTFNI